MRIIESDFRDERQRKKHTNWALLNRALPGKMGLSNIDGILERRGGFLVLEAKRPGELLPPGQEIMLKQLARVPGVEVWVVFMEDPTEGEVIGWARWGEKEATIGNTEQFSQLVLGWLAYQEER